MLSGVRVTRSLVLCLCFVDRCLSFCTHEKYQRDSLLYWYPGKNTTPLKPFFSFILFNFFQQEIINIAFLAGSVLLIFLVFCVVLLCVLMFLVPCCDVRYDFCIKTSADVLLFVGVLMSCCL